MSIITAVICFLLAIVCVIVLYFKLPELTMQHPVSASLLASSFFFVFIAFVFSVIGNADIPSFKIETATAEPLDNEKIKEEK